MTRRLSTLLGALLVLVAISTPRPAAAVYSCGGYNDDFNCGGYNPYPCCDNGGNCTWWAWDRACRGWGVDLPGWGNANTWAQYANNNSAFDVLSYPVVGSIAVRDVGEYGHVAWVTEVNGSTIKVSEMNCWGGYGSQSKSYSASYFTGGFIVRAGTSVTCSTSNGALIKAEGDPTVYYMLNGRRWPIHNEDVFFALGLDFDDVCVTSGSTVEALPLGPKVGADGTMFLCSTCSNPAAVYLIDGSQRRHIDDEWVLQTCLGMSLQDVFTKGTQGLKDLFSVGSQITGECDPYASESAACGQCGQKTRTCDGQCHWGGWSSCQGQGECSPYATESDDCGNCGQRQRTCTSSCSWGGWSSCQGQGECSPGQTSSNDCGNCGQQTRSCTSSCSWGGWSSCQGQGECTPYAQDSGSCGQCGEHTRSCSSSCSWQGWSQCLDEGECSPGMTQQQACGACGQQSRSCDGTCGWGPWGLCTGQGACTPGETEQRPCASGCGVEERTCGQSCSWGAWGSCSGVAPCVDGTTESEACGACGTRTRTCQGCSGWGDWSACSGEGECAPGTTATETCPSGCGEHTRTCDASCGWPAWSACPSAAVACDDSDPCTADACSGGACQHTPIALCCVNNGDCPAGTATVTYTCESGTCVPQSTGACTGAADCGDDDPCTQDHCDTATGDCSWSAVVGCCRSAADCDDGDACTTDQCGSDHTCVNQAPACAGVECSTDGCCGTCPQGSTCDASGQCTGGETIACDADHTEAGRCEGETLYACVDGVGVERDCAAAGMRCRPGALDPTVMGCVVGCGAATSAVCVGDVVYFCVESEPWSDDCGRYGLSCGALGDGGVGCVAACPSVCPPGTHCEGTACVTDGGTVADPDPTDVSGVPGEPGGGCQGGPTHGGWLALLLALAWIARRRCDGGLRTSHE